MTDDVVRWHLQGRDDSGQAFVAGVYPFLLDETCFFLAADFDKAGWQADAVAFLQVCRRLDLDAALERSRSGRGGHVWLFFEDAIPASLARRLGSHLLTEAMEARPDVGLDSYGRLFPNQDTLPQGGFGNLIAWLLQRGPRDPHRGCRPAFVGRELSDRYVLGDASRTHVLGKGDGLTVIVLMNLDDADPQAILNGVARLYLPDGGR